MVSNLIEVRADEKITRKTSVGLPYVFYGYGIYIAVEIS